MQDLPPPPKPYYCFVKKSPLASIIKFPPNKEQKDPAYKDLVCTEQDKGNIYELITTISRNGKGSLLFKMSYLKNLGGSVEHVHPLKFLGAIFSHPELKECMWGVFDDNFKRGRFMGGLAPNLTMEANKGKLMQYLNDFSNEVGHHPHNTHHIKAYFESQEWEDLVRFLMKN